MQPNLKPRTVNLTLPNRTSPQRLIQESRARFKIAAWGRQSGKTTNGGWTLIKKPLEGRRGGRYWHVLQTHSAADVAFDRYVRLFPRSSWSELFAKRPNESDKTVFLTGWREVQFKSGENYQDLRGDTLDGAIIDECRQQQKEVWTQVVRPALARRKGWCDFYSTPNGFDWFFDLTEFAKTHPEEWALFHAPSTAAWWWTPEEIDSAKSSMTEAEFAQEILAEFRDLTAGKVYMSFGDHNRATESPFMPGKKWSPYLPIILGADFNLSPMCWTLGQTAKEQWHWFNEIHLKASHTMEAARELVQKVGMMKAEGHRASVDMIMCGDATGKATQRSSNQSDYDIIKLMLKEANISFQDQTPEANPSVKDRVNAVNTKCRNARGDVEMFVDFADCPMLVHDFQRVVWKNGADSIIDPGKNRELGHQTDSVGYPIHRITPIRGVREIGKTRIIQRIL